MPASHWNRKAAEEAAKSYFQSEVRFEDRVIEDPEDGSVVECVRILIPKQAGSYTAYLQFLRDWWVLNFPNRSLTFDYERDR